MKIVELQPCVVCLYVCVCGLAACCLCCVLAVMTVQSASKLQT